MRLYGIIVPLITPFRGDYSVDIEALKWLTGYLVSSGVHGLFPNSTTGEFVHLTREESVLVVKAVLEEAGDKAWILPGITANSTEECIKLGKVFVDMGVTGVVVAPPFFFKLAPKRLKEHFSKIAETLDIPVVVYNLPALTGVNIPVQLYVELAAEYDNLAGAKVTYDSFTYTRTLIQEVKSVRRDFAVFTGLDDMLLPVLMMGGDGGITALANATPQLHLAMYNAWSRGDIELALDAWKKLLKLTKVYDYTSSYPTAVKTVLAALGTPVKPHPRPPLAPEPPEIEARVKRILEELGLRKAPSS
ncbi:MAG: dihydrodipicolinate synthase family protein [Desulfurococcaceae archaeon]